MREKRPVYNGYEERYATGEELRRIFLGEYLVDKGRNSPILRISIPDYLSFLGIKDSKTYRIFINQFFCKVMNANTDGTIDFFGHQTLEYVKLYKNPKDIHLEQNCPQCNAAMKLKRGKFGPFLGCSKYPVCKTTINIPVIGYFDPPMEVRLKLAEDYAKLHLYSK